jgi:hypothetical protein
MADQDKEPIGVEELEPDNPAEESPEPAPEPEPEGEPIDLGGLPFKSIPDFVKAHKELQGTFTKTSERVKELESTLSRVLQLLPRQEAAAAKAGIAEDPKAFLEAFLENPINALNTLIQRAMNSEYSSKVGPALEQVRMDRINAQVDHFLGQHPELQEEDQDKLLKIMDDYPEIARKDNPMERYYRILVADHPEIKERAGIPLKTAKQAASLGGKKATVSKSASTDPFDEVLELEKDIVSKF